MLTRRSFFAATIGLLLTPYTVGKNTYGVTQLPAYKQKGAVSYLTQVWNNFSKGKRAADLPKQILVSESFYDTFVSELPPVNRFHVLEGNKGTNQKSLMFKSAVLKISPRLKDWDTRID